MVKKQLKGAIELSSSPEKEEEHVIDLQGSPVRAIFCLKRKKLNMREIEDREDCFILDFDPDDDPVDLFHIKRPKDLHYPNSPDLCVLAEKGPAMEVGFVVATDIYVLYSAPTNTIMKVPCRDYPHSRHLCVKNCFERTPHENYCELCFCFVCDTAAPCKSWSGGNGHCHAIANEAWKSQRKKMRGRRE